MANTALENIKSAPGKAMDAVAGGVSAAMAAISSFLNNLAFPEDTDKSLGENVQAQLVAMVGKLNLPPEMKNKILRTIQGANLADAEKLMRTELTNQPTKRTSDVYLKPGSASRTDIPGKQYNTKQLKKWKELKELTRKFDKEMQAKNNGAAIAEKLGRAWEKQHEVSRSDVDPSNPTYQLLLKLRILFAEDMLHDGLFQTAQLTELQKRIDAMGDLPQDELRGKIMEEINDIKQNEYNRIYQEREERNARLEAEYERNKQVQEQR